LKTLEEPPDNTLIFMLVSQFNSLLPTIRSRCQPIALKPLSKAQMHKIIASLAEEEIDSQRVELLAPIAGSSPGTLLKLLDDEFDEVYKLLYKHLFEQKRKTPFPAADELLPLLKRPYDTKLEPVRQRLKAAIGLVIIWLRDELFRSLALSEQPIDAHRRASGDGLVSPPDQLISAIDKLYELAELVDRNLNLNVLIQEFLSIAVVIN